MATTARIADQVRCKTKDVGSTNIRNFQLHGLAGMSTLAHAGAATGPTQYMDLTKRPVTWPTYLSAQRSCSLILVLIFGLSYFPQLAPIVAIYSPLLLYAFEIARHILLISRVSQRQGEQHDNRAEPQALRNDHLRLQEGRHG